MNKMITRKMVTQIVMRPYGSRAGKTLLISPCASISTMLWHLLQISKEDRKWVLSFKTVEKPKRLRK